ncbi:probable acyl-activating enzyme 5, peroxisomal [Olea europaea var. sylvestris]|uniref:probable acyl-activating enzyme 5, peroxisomal n=1 Tax=Olea europaea var. sylvestris TaxID=158386 RepID=UPI000C1D5706|nr:probable acyl-activating enzyme 5, peroxisomal [Olea europaea var. sylvestris]
MDQLKPSSPNSSPLTPIGFLERAATVYADCPSILYNSATYTWSETYVRCLKLASSIVSLGIKRGQVVSVLAPNVPAMYELHFAIPMAGAVLNTINLRLDARTISVILRHAESKLVFVDCQSESLVVEALSLFPSNSQRPLLVFITDDGFESPEFYRNYEGMVQDGDSKFNWVRPESEFDPLTLNYTSGTTSSPKGVVHSHRGTFIVSMDSLHEWSVPKEPVYLWTLPMFHANGWSFTWGMAAVGATNVCLRKFDTTVIYTLIRNHKVTHMCGAPVVLNMLSNVPDGSIALESPVHVITAGAPPAAAVLFRTESLGFIVTHGYGLTETGGLVICCSWKQKWNKLPATERARLKARQGVKTPGMAEVDVIDPESEKSVNRDGKTLGEIVLRGGSVILGYLKDPQATSKCMKNGWFYTGDVGVMHPDGYLEIKDRSKDVIISGGENLSSVEVESVLYMHPAINEAAVVARPDEFWGETPCAFVSLKIGAKENLTEKDVMVFCREKLPRYMVPKTVVFKDELPRTSTGKIQKFVLREMAKKMGSIKTSRL